MLNLSKCLCVCIAAAGLALAGCGREADKAARSQEDASAPAAPARASAPAYDTPSRGGESNDRTVASAPEAVARQWAPSRRGGAGAAAERQFERNGADFAARDVAAYVAKARAFVDSPPKNVLTVTRSNGDVLYYDPDANVFAVADKTGAPRTMFKPRDGMGYWTAQKQQVAEGGSGRRQRRGSDDREEASGDAAG